MKKSVIKRLFPLSLIILITFIASTLLVSIQSCSEKESDEILNNNPALVKNSTYLVTSSNVFGDSLFIFPEGTLLWIANDHLCYDLPDNYLLLTNTLELYEDGTEEMVVKSSNQGSITCNCTEGKGCDPFVMQGVSGCTPKSTCTKCEITQESSTGGTSGLKSVKNIIEEIVLDGVVVNFNIPNRFYSDLISFDIDALPLLKSPKSFIFENEDVMQRLTDLFRGYNSEEDDAILIQCNKDNLDDRYAYVPTRFLGYLIFLPLNKQVSTSAHYASLPGGTGNVLNDDNYTCTCESGQNGCTLQSKWTPCGKIYYCDSGNCTKCKMSGDDI